jgi:hypothetical protein
MAATLVKTETVYNTRDNSRTTTQTYESFDGVGGEIDNMANRKVSHENGVYRYSGETIEYFEGTGSTSAGGGGGGEGGDIYFLEISTGSEPIETHPIFKPISNDFWKLWEIWKTDKTSDLLKSEKIGALSIYATNGYWDPFNYTSEPISLLVEKFSKGVRDYLTPKVVSRYQTSGPASNLGNVGKIDSPPYSGGIGGDRNWLFTGASSRWNVATSTFETTYEWLASGPLKWDEDLYT